MASAVIGALRVNLSADTAEFKRNMTTAEAVAHKFGYSIGSTLRKQLLGLGAAAAAAAGPAAIGLLVKSSVNAVSAQVDLANRVGASVAAIQTLQHAAELSGASSESLAKALGTLNTKLGEAAQKGAGPAYEAIQRLGLSISELSNADADTRIKMISDRMAELGFTTQETGATLRALGIKQQEIINLFQEGSNAITNSRSELQAWGVLLSDVDAAKIEQAGDAWDKIGKVLEGVGNQLAIRLAPVIIKVSEYITDAAKETGGFGSAIDKAINIGISLFKSLNEEIARDSALIEVITRKMQLAQEVLSSFRIGKEGGVDWDAFRQAHESATSDIAKIWSDMDAKLQNLKGPESLLTGLDQYLNKTNALVQGVDAYIAKINKPAQATDDGTSDAEQKALDKLAKSREEELLSFQENLAERLSSLQESLMTEREAITADYDQKLLDLETFHAQGMLSEDEYRNYLLRAHQDYSEKIKDLNEEVAEDAWRNVQRQLGAYETLAGDIGTVLNAIFGESKLVAIAQAIINTAQAITKNLAEYPGPLGFAMAAAAAAAGAAQIATISRTTKSSKGGGSSSTTSGSAAAASSAATSSSSSSQAGASQTLYISGISASSLYSGESVRDLARALIDYQRDGGKIVLGNT